MSLGEGIHRAVGRQTPAAGAHIFLGQPNIFYITVNSKDGVPWIANTAVQNSLIEPWSKEETAWLIGYYLLMPDHLHFFCAPNDLHFGIDQWVEFWKRQFSRNQKNAAWAWQRKSFHHRLRDRLEYEEKLAYARENPIRKNLVRRSEDWPSQGRIHDIQWTAD